METSTLEIVSTREFTIKKAEQSDVVEAVYITKVVLRHLMKDHAVHPDMFENLYEIFSAHVLSGSLFILKKSNVCLGLLTYNGNEPAEFGNLNWKYDGMPFFYVSRIFILPHWRNKGIGHALLKYAEELAIGRGLKIIRLDSLNNFDEDDLTNGNNYRFAGNRLISQKVPVSCYEININADKPEQ